jgi:hypothetical protein
MNAEMKNGKTKQGKKTELAGACVRVWCESAGKNLVPAWDV